MIIDSVLINEKERNAKMIAIYEKEIAMLPKGSLIYKKSGYCYLKYRSNGKVIDKYLGKDEGVIREYSSKILLRKHYQEMLAELLEERKRIIKMIGE